MDAPKVHWAQLSLKQVTSKSSAAILNPDICVLFGNEKHIWLPCLIRQAQNTYPAYHQKLLE
jgi:hypothetical protein